QQPRASLHPGAPPLPAGRRAQASTAGRDRGAAAGSHAAAAGLPVRPPVSRAPADLRRGLPVGGGRRQRPPGALRRRGRRPPRRPMTLEGVELKRYFPARRGLSLGGERRWIKALDGVSVQVAEGETLGIVGESGSGKTTLAKLFLLLERPTAGSVLFDG